MPQFNIPDYSTAPRNPLVYIAGFAATFIGLNLLSRAALDAWGYDAYYPEGFVFLSDGRVIDRDGNSTTAEAAHAEIEKLREYSPEHH